MIEKGLKHSSINKALSSFKASLNRASDWNFIKKNPIAQVKQQKDDNNPNVRYLTTKEEDCLRKALNEREERLRIERRNANKWRNERGYTLYPNFNNKPFADHLNQ